MLRSIRLTLLRRCAATTLLLLTTVAVAADPAPVAADLGGLQTIQVRSADDQGAARILSRAIRLHYGVALKVVMGEETPDAGLFVGRAAAVATGLIDAEALAAVSQDGFVIRRQGNRVALAGYAPQGTTYAVYAFLRRLGIRTYPGVGSRPFVVFAPPATVGGDFSISSRPFYNHRDIRGYLGRGAFGATVREQSLGDPGKIAEPEWFKERGWLGWDHTAAYLVPMAKYYAEHPEYFAMKGGKRIPEKTDNNRVTLCLSNPEVHRISAERALEWVGRQSERQFFVISDGDSRACNCEPCRKLLPAPGDHTDRQMGWINSVATAVDAKFPGKTILGLAYQQTAAAPTKVLPAANVTVMYCPWYWLSRYSSATTWAHPGNTEAMREFMAWAIRCPGQVGVYDYPVTHTAGGAQRLKFFAKHGVRVYYSNGGRGNRYQWVNSQLLWDPFLDAKALSDEFVAAYYGPAAATMKAYYALLDRSELRYSRAIWRYPEFAPVAMKLIRQAAEQASSADPAAKSRIRESASITMGGLLRQTHPSKGWSNIRSSIDGFRDDLAAYLALHRALLDDLEGPRQKHNMRTYAKRFEQVMKGLGSPMAARDESLDQQPADPVEYGKAVAAALVAKLEHPAAAPAPAEPLPDDIRSFTDADGWQASGDDGQARLEATLAEPLDGKKRPTVALHLTAATPVPITVHAGPVSVDFELHAGEQIIRFNLRNCFKAAEFNEWDGRLDKLAIDIFPRDTPPDAGQAPRPVLHSVTATASKPEPQALPHRGKAIWLTALRPNHKHGISVPDAGKRERFRSFTEHRFVTPLQEIVCADDVAEDKAAAVRLQTALTALFGVKLPVTASRAGAQRGNRIVVGRAAGLAAGGVTTAELDYAGPHGLVINAYAGQVVIAGADAAGTVNGIGRYLAYHGAQFTPGGVRLTEKGEFLRELYLVDRSFAKKPVATAWQQPWQVIEAPPAVTDRDAVLRLAQAIKRAARNSPDLPANLAPSAQPSAATRYVAARLWWDPFTDVGDVLLDL